jgi:hypothetical protein
MRIIINQMLFAKGKSRRLRGAELVSSGERERERERERETEKDNVY